MNRKRAPESSTCSTNEKLFVLPKTHQEKLMNEWDARIAANLSVVLTNDINMPEEEHPIPFDVAAEKPIDEQR